MDNGGHGKLDYRLTPGIRQIIIPPVAGHSFELPENFFLVKAHANPIWDQADAYLPPCSGGKRNHHYVTVKAVYLAPEGDQSLLLGHAKLNLGHYCGEPVAAAVLSSGGYRTRPISCSQ
ncbi:hypothetical protein [Malonomonas rubra]|uniref:hypothetical protein n=1 Tax=Malonomonas rubra TaxID=57040 RepID=UPI0026EFB0D6|nr:hypothetical protein [Malonomonas rubra]